MRHPLLMSALTLVLALAPLPAQAQTPAGGAPNVLTTQQVTVFNNLVAQAKENDPAYLKARAQELAGRTDAGVFGAVTGNAAVTLSTSGGFDQVAPGARLSVGVDLNKLFAAATGGNAAQVQALTASTSAAARDLRVRVLRAYTCYLYAIRAAGVAADALELGRAAVGQARARAAAGAATGVDVLRARQQENQADASLYQANLNLAVAKQELAAVVGVDLAELDRLLNGAKPRP